MDVKEAEKKRSLRNEKLKANRTSETEEHRKERLRIRREKDRARRRTKGKKRSPDTDDNEKERLATLKRLKRGEMHRPGAKVRRGRVLPVRKRPLNMFGTLPPFYRDC